MIISSWSLETELIMEHEISVTLRYCHSLSQENQYKEKKNLLTLFILALDPLQVIIKTYNNVLWWMIIFLLLEPTFCLEIYW